MPELLKQTYLELDQGDTGEYVLGPLTIDDPVSGASNPLDLTQVGTKAWFTAKESKSDSDANAKIRKGSPSTGQSGIVLNTPVSTDKNYLTVTIAPSDTETLAAPLNLYYDLQVLEPSGRKTTVKRGILSIAPDVTDA